MPKDILIYGRIDEWSTLRFFDALAESQESASEDSIPVFRICTQGGEPEYGWSIAAKIAEAPKKKLKVDGKAYSWGSLHLLYAKKEEIEALDVSQFMIHRAAYPDWFEKSDYFTEPLKQNLSAINSKLETAFRNRVDVAAFENLKQCKEKNITVKSIFSMDDRVDVFFSAADAKKIGLVGSIVKITPSKAAEVNADLKAVAEARSGILVPLDEKELQITTEIPKSSDMTIEKLKTENPDVYNSIFELGVAAGITREKDRVESCMVFVEIDPAGVKEAIKSGKPLTDTQRSEFALKANSPETLAKLKKDSQGSVITSEANDVEKTKKQEAVAKFEASVDAQLGLGTKK